MPAAPGSKPCAPGLKPVRHRACPAKCTDGAAATKSADPVKQHPLAEAADASTQKISKLLTSDAFRIK